MLKIITDSEIIELKNPSDCQIGYRLKLGGVLFDLLGVIRYRVLVQLRVFRSKTTTVRISQKK